KGSATADDAQQIENASDSSRTATQHLCRFGPEKKFTNFETVILFLQSCVLVFAIILYGRAGPEI
ncbi:MAG: hypothetical protein PVI45_02860, partial [Desulfobacterales bacterium]